MARINIYSEPDDYDGSKVLEGWFDPDKAACYKQDTRWDGHNQVGVITGKWSVHEHLYRTSGGRWVLRRDETTQQGGRDTYRFVSDEQAHDWLLRSECNDDAVAKWFGQVEEERGPGRPVIGPEVKVRLPQEQADAVDKMAAEAGISRSEMLRKLVTAALS